MIVIKGKREKSAHIENVIRKEFRTHNVLIMDAAEKGVRRWTEGHWATIWTLDEYPTFENAIKSFENGYDTVKEFDWIVLHFNSIEDSIEKYKELDRKYPQNFIVTIQSDDSRTSKYFI